MSNSTLTPDYENTIYIDAEYLVFEGIIEKPHEPYEVIAIHTLPKHEFDWVTEFFFGEDGAFPDSFKRDGELIYKFIVISKTHYQKVNNFIVDSKLKDFSTLIFILLGLGMKAHLDNTVPNPIPGEEKVRLDRFDQRKLDELIAFQGGKGIQKINKLFGLINDVYDGNSGSSLEKVSFTFKNHNGEKVSIEFKSLWETTVLRNIISIFQERIGSKTLEEYIQRGFYMEIKHEKSVANYRERKAFCRGFINLVKQNLIKAKLSDRELFRMFYDFYMLCGYMDPRIYEGAWPQAVISNWYHRG